MRFPVFYEHSKVPAKLSKLAPINIGAISLALWVFVLGEADTRMRTHETIHFRQQLELLFLPFYILYGLFYLVGCVRYRDGKKAYRMIPFEQEAYNNEEDESYLAVRRYFAWVKLCKWPKAYPVKPASASGASE